MNDHEMTKLCAEAMGYAIAEYSAYVGPGVGVVKEGECVGFWFDPLHDDAQAMALLKRYRLPIKLHTLYDEQPYGCPAWIVNDCMSENLNRAIVECVAKMQGTKA